MAKRPNPDSRAPGTTGTPGNKPARKPAARKVAGKPAGKAPRVTRPRKTSADARSIESAPVAQGAPAATAKPRKAVSPEDRRIRDFARTAARLAHDSHCSEVVLLDVRELSDISDYILIATGVSDRQIRSVGNDIELLAKESRLAKMGRDSDGRSSWVVLDFVDVVVHLFDGVARAHYDLEMMWGDAPKVRWQRKADAPKPGTQDAAGGADEADADGDDAEA